MLNTAMFTTIDAAMPNSGAVEAGDAGHSHAAAQTTIGTGDHHGEKAPRKARALVVGKQQAHGLRVRARRDDGGARDDEEDSGVDRHREVGRETVELAQAEEVAEDREARDRHRHDGEARRDREAALRPPLQREERETRQDEIECGIGGDGIAVRYQEDRPWNNHASCPMSTSVT